MSHKRAKFIYFFVVCYFVLLVFKLFYLQGIRADDYRAQVEIQIEGKRIIRAKRGLIYARDMFPLAENEISFILNFDKNLLPKNEKIQKSQLDDLIELLTSDENVFAPTRDKSLLKTRKENVKKYVYDIFANKRVKAGVIYKKLQEKTKNKIQKLNISVLYFTNEILRRYPESSMSAHTLGFLGRDARDEQKGFFGIEGYYDLELKGLDGFEVFEQDALGRPILLNLFDKKDSIDGKNLITSLDRSVQKIVDKWLKWGVTKFAAKAATAIVYDPEAGEIIAMANIPSYDPNRYYLYPDAVKKNIAISDTYEPGSIMKPLVMAAAINEKVLTKETLCPRCGGSVEKSGYLIKTFDDTYQSGIDMTEILVRSSNVGMTYVGDLLKEDRMLSYFKKIGFGQPTGVDLEGEASGFVKQKQDIYDIDLATMTFGQGISVTSMQMVKAWGALATGRVIEPRVVASFQDKSLKGRLKMQNSQPIYSRETVATIKEMLATVCEKSPLHFARDNWTPELKNYKIAAKSGTAQIPIAGKYVNNKTIGTVIGFVPQSRPKFILFVKLDEAQANIWGANTAGPVFFQIMKDLLMYYNIAPE